MCRGEFGEETALCRSPGSGWDRTFPFARPRRLPKRMGKANRIQKQQDHITNRKERKGKLSNEKIAYIVVLWSSFCKECDGGIQFRVVLCLKAHFQQSIRNTDCDSRLHQLHIRQTEIPDQTRFLLQDEKLVNGVLNRCLRLMTMKMNNLNDLGEATKKNVNRLI